eukprot:9388161-Ditylum_brightwellii.AAC.1
MDPKFFDKFLGDYRDTEAFTSGSESQWATGSGVFMSKGKVAIRNMCLPSFTMKHRFSASFGFLPEGGEHTYQIILGMADLCRLEMYFDLKKDLVKWLGISLPKHKINAFWSEVRKQAVNVRQQKRDEKFEYHGIVLAANKYKAPVLEQLVQEEKYKHLTKEQRNKVLGLLKKHEQLFQGKQGEWCSSPVALRLKPGVKLYMAKLYPVPLPQQAEAKKELDRQIATGILWKLLPEEADAAEWAFPMFFVPKKDKVSMRTVSNFRRLNELLIRSPKFIEPINDLLASLGAWSWVSNINFNMGYYIMGLCPATQQLGGRYQAKTTQNLHPIQGSRIAGKHIKVSTVPESAQACRLLARAKWLPTPCFTDPGHPQGGTATRQEGGPHIQQNGELHQNHIPKRAVVLEPITRLTRGNEPFVWGRSRRPLSRRPNSLCQKEMMFVYPRLDKPFDLYPDACNVQISGFLMQEGFTLECFLCKMNTVQKNYPMMDKELLAAHQSLKHFDNIIWGGKIWNFCNHKNLTFGSTMPHQSQRILRQKIDISNDYNAEFIHIARTDNPGGDAMRRLPTRASTVDEQEAFFNLTVYNFDNVFPLDMAYIKENQETDEELRRMMSRKKMRQQFARVMLREVEVMTYQGKEWVPENCREELVEWYHENLQYRGNELMQQTIGTNFCWPQWTAQIAQCVNQCTLCQEYNITGHKNYGKIPIQEKKEDIEPWSSVHLDMAGPWKDQFRHSKRGKIYDVKLQMMTAADQRTGFPEI